MVDNAFADVAELLAGVARDHVVPAVAAGRCCIRHVHPPHYLRPGRKSRKFFQNAIVDLFSAALRPTRV